MSTGKRGLTCYCCRQQNVGLNANSHCTSEKHHARTKLIATPSCTLQVLKYYTLVTFF